MKLKRLIYYSMVGMLFFSCKDNPVKQNPIEVNIEIIKPENSSIFWNDESVPCEVEMEGGTPNQVNWKVDQKDYSGFGSGISVNCVNGEIFFHRLIISQALVISLSMLH